MLIWNSYSGFTYVYNAFLKIEHLTTTNKLHTKLNLCTKLVKLSNTDYILIAKERLDQSDQRSET